MKECGKERDGRSGGSAVSGGDSERKRKRKPSTMRGLPMGNDSLTEILLLSNRNGENAPKQNTVKFSTNMSLLLAVNRCKQQGEYYAGAVSGRS